MLINGEHMIFKQSSFILKPSFSKFKQIISRFFEIIYFYILICMYVCTSVCQVLMNGPTHTEDALRPWPPRYEHRGGTPLSMDVPRVAWSATWGHVCIYIYIYCLCHCRCVPFAAKARRLFCLRSLSEQWSVPVIPSVSALAFLLLATCRAAAAVAAPLLRRQFAITCMFYSLACPLALPSKSASLNPTPHSTPPGHILLTRCFAYGLSGRP